MYLCACVCGNIRLVSGLNHTLVYLTAYFQCIVIEKNVFLDGNRELVLFRTSFSMFSDRAASSGNLQQNTLQPHNKCSTCMAFI